MSITTPHTRTSSLAKAQAREKPAYPANLIEQAVEQALTYGCVHWDGVLHCLHQLTDPKEPTTSLDLSDRPDLQQIGNQPVDLSRYELLLKHIW